MFPEAFCNNVIKKRYDSQLECNDTQRIYLGLHRPCRKELLEQQDVVRRLVKLGLTCFPQGPKGAPQGPVFIKMLRYERGDKRPIPPQIRRRGTLDGTERRRVSGRMMPVASFFAAAPNCVQPSNARCGRVSYAELSPERSQVYLGGL